MGRSFRHHYMFPGIIAVTATLLFLCYRILYAASLTVTLTVGLASITFSGFSSPDSFITITENNTAVGTGSAASDGTFSKTLTGVQPGIHTYYLTVTDSLGNLSSPISFDVALSEAQTYELGNIIFPPTLYSSNSSVTPGSNINIQGLTAPGSSVEIYLNSSLIATVSSDSVGAFNYSLSTSNIGNGNYTVYALTHHPSGGSSEKSNGLSITIGNSVNPSPSASVVPSGSPVLTSPAASRRPLSTPKISPTPSPSSDSGFYLISPNPSPVPIQAVTPRELLTTIASLSFLQNLLMYLALFLLSYILLKLLGFFERDRVRKIFFFLPIWHRKRREEDKSSEI